MTEAEHARILSELSLIRDRLEKNEQLFDLTTDDVETEALIYERKALMLRYSRLFRRARGENEKKTEKESTENDGNDIRGSGGAADD